MNQAIPTPSSQITKEGPAYFAGSTEKKTGITFRLTVFFLLLMLAVTALSYFALSRQSLRLDESQSLWQSSHSPFGVIETISHDVHVPLYGLLLHFWMLYFGNSVALGRSLSLIFFLLSIPAIFLLAKTAYNRKVAVFATILLASSPFLNWYGNEMRMYSLLTLLTILNQYFFVKIYKAKSLRLTQSSIAYSWWGLLLVCLLGIYTHYFFWLLLFAEGVFFIINRKRFPEKSARNIIIISAVLIMAIAPWLVYVKLQGGLSNQTPTLNKPSSEDLFNVFSQFLFGFQDDHINTIILSMWPLTVLLAFLSLTKKKASPLTLYFLSILLLPVIAAFLVSIWIKPVFLARYLILAAPSLYVFLAWLFSQYPPVLNRALQVVLCGLMVFTLYQQVAAADTPVKENYQQATDYISNRAGADDVVVLSAPFTIYPFEYYYHGPLAVTTLPNWNPYQIGPIPAFSENTLPQQIDQIKSGHRKIWLLLSYDQGYQQNIFIYFETHFQRLDHQNFSPGLDLYVYQVSYPAK